jgi:flagellar hook-associated protein FlgK
VTTVVNGLKDEEQKLIEELRARVEVGIQQADRGEFVEFTAEDVKAEARKRLSA